MEQNKSSEVSLFEKVGGENSIKALVEEFYERVLADDLLTPVFQRVDMSRLKRHQTLFISQALGGPKQYDGREMGEAHRNLGITSDQFDAVAGHLQGAMGALGLSKGDIATVLGVVAPLKEQIVSPPPQGEGSLYDQLGGQVTIKAVVEEFYGRVLADPSLAPMFAGVEMGRLKRHQALFISQALGGPKQYDGRSMYEAHKSLGVSADQFDRVAEHLVGTLHHLDLSQDDIDTIVGQVAPLKSEIVTDPFTRWLKAG